VILIGQYDSPFVRRVAITLRLYGIPYEHRRWSVWGDADKIAEHNPLRRAPTLLLDDGTALVETFAIVDALDDLAPPERALIPRSGPTRREVLRIAALSTGMADKAASLMHEPMFREIPSQVWMRRCTSQITGTLEALERDRSARSSRYWFGPSLCHADVAFACALRFTREAHPTIFDPARFPALSDTASRCESLPEFLSIYQAITNNI